ncbi:15-hydroxyprostaglandin dehydrogenase [NAD(+)]-like isoform X2 [Centruroides vittatus]|uniref:15-hydroxyprostaglandin dehydrogenase [NAD(+)]-like isoform X2 n=1 Tax=Centruroides vittatus TaxID=120091 RepID=UPI00350EBB3A
MFNIIAACCEKSEKYVDVENGRALVTGGAQGIGRAICEALLSRGCKVCCADVNLEEGQRTVEELQKTYGESNCIFVECDVSSSENFEEAYLKAKESLGNLNILINNAGVSEGDKIVETNLNGVIYGCNIALKYMGKNNGGDGGAVVNVASVGGLQAMPHNPIYVATNAGIIALTRCYGQDFHYEKSRIKFNVVCPAAVNTKLYQSATKSMNIDQDIKEFIDKYLPMESSKVADAIIQLINEERNGAVMTVINGKKNTYIKFLDRKFIK